MVFTLHRYIFRDLFKAFTLTTIILSFVMGLGVMLRPLREFSLDPARVPEMLFYTLPITMTMVIPIAALMATTLVYGRLAFENEITGAGSMPNVAPGAEADIKMHQDSIGIAVSWDL